MQLYKKELIYYNVLQFVKTGSRSKLIHLLIDIDWLLTTDSLISTDLMIRLVYHTP